MKMAFQEIRIIATGPCIANQLRDANTMEYIMLKIRYGNLKYFVLSVWEMGKMKYVKSII